MAYRDRPARPVWIGVALALGFATSACTETAQTAETADANGRPGATGGVEGSQDGFRAMLVGESTDRREAFPAPDPAANALYYSVVVGESWQHQRVVVSQAAGDGWSEPESVAFSDDERYSDRAPRFSPDGLRLIFTSNRPMPGLEHDPDDFNLWVVERSSVGEAWSRPRPLSDAVNTTSREIHASITSDGTLYFASARPGGHGRSDIYRATRSGNGYRPAENVGPPISTEQSQPDLLVMPDGSMMILVVTDHPSGIGGDDLFVSHFRNGGWTEPRNLGPAVNTPEYEYGPTLSRDGSYLYFTSHRSGGGDTYRIAMSDLNLGR